MPDTHVVVLKASDIVPTVPQAVEILGKNPTPSDDLDRRRFGDLRHRAGPRQRRARPPVSCESSSSSDLITTRCRLPHGSRAPCVYGSYPRTRMTLGISEPEASQHLRVGLPVLRGAHVQVKVDAPTQQLLDVRAGLGADLLEAASPYGR